ncbi:MAG: hypothetical protein ACTSO3_01205 [Candidatus Heimdallarchaeaceae archaeon]
MIIYYQKSTKQILSIVNHDAKKYLDDEQLEGELDLIYPNLKNDVGVSRFKEVENQKVECGGFWDSEKNIQTAPRPETIKTEHPHKDRIRYLFENMETGTATLAEVQEYLVKANLTKRITQ